jgi:hypothetical protein
MCRLSFTLRAPSYRRHQYLYNCCRLHCWSPARPIEALGIFHAIHRNADWAPGFVQGQLEIYSMSSRPSETTIDRIVASYNGDIHGALRALLLVNEQLEAELQQLYAAVAVGGPFERGSNALH